MEAVACHGRCAERQDVDSNAHQEHLHWRGEVGRSGCRARSSQPAMIPAPRHSAAWPPSHNIPPCSHLHRPQQAGPPGSESLTRPGWARLSINPRLLPEAPTLTFTRDPHGCGPWEKGGRAGGVGREA